MEPVTTARSEWAILEQGRIWLENGQRVALATVAHTWGSSPRPVGALMVLSESGQFLGSVSGGCIEEELIERVTSQFPSQFETLEYDSDTSRTLPCGGRLLLTIEPMSSIDGLAEMMSALAAGSAVNRTIVLDTGEVSWDEATAEQKTVLSDGVLSLVYEPEWRLMIVGAGELAQWVCRLAQLLDYRVHACDPRPDYQQTWPFDEVSLATDYPDDFLSISSVDQRSAIVALTHDPKIDDLAIIEALAGNAFYVGALGSRRTTAKRAERLEQHFNLKPEQIARIRGPIGIDLNTRRPQEIALAVMTEITAARNGVSIQTARTTAI